MFPEEVISSKMFLERAQNLYMHSIKAHSDEPHCMKPVPFTNIHVEQFVLTIRSLDTPVITHGQNLDDMVMWFTESSLNLYITKQT